MSDPALDGFEFDDPNDPTLQRLLKSSRGGDVSTAEENSDLLDAPDLNADLLDAPDADEGGDADDAETRVNRLEPVRIEGEWRTMPEEEAALRGAADVASFARPDEAFASGAADRASHEHLGINKLVDPVLRMFGVDIPENVEPYERDTTRALTPDEDYRQERSAFEALAARDRATGGTFRDAQTSWREEDKRALAERPLEFRSGQVGAGLLTAAAPMGPALKGAKGLALAGRIGAGGATSGSLYASGETEEEDLLDQARDTVVGGGSGALAALGTAGLIKGGIGTVKAIPQAARWVGDKWTQAGAKVHGMTMPTELAEAGKRIVSNTPEGKALRTDVLAGEEAAYVPQVTEELTNLQRAIDPVRDYANVSMKPEVIGKAIAEDFPRMVAPDEVVKARAARQAAQSAAEQSAAKLADLQKAARTAKAQATRALKAAEMAKRAGQGSRDPATRAAVAEAEKKAAKLVKAAESASARAERARAQVAAREAKVTKVSESFEDVALPTSQEMAQAQQSAAYDALSSARSAMEFLQKYHNGAGAARKLGRVLEELKPMFGKGSQGAGPESARDMFIAIDKLKRGVGELLQSDDQTIRAVAKETYEPLRRSLEDAALWGESAAGKQMRTNEAYTKAITAEKAGFPGAFLSPSPSERITDNTRNLMVGDTSKIGGFMRGLGTDEAASKLDLFKTSVRAQADLADTLAREYEVPSDLLQLAQRGKQFAGSLDSTLERATREATAARTMKALEEAAARDIGLMGTVRKVLPHPAQAGRVLATGEREMARRAAAQPPPVPNAQAEALRALAGRSTDALAGRMGGGFAVPSRAVTAAADMPDEQPGGIIDAEGEFTPDPTADAAAEQEQREALDMTRGHELEVKVREVIDVQPDYFGEYADRLIDAADSEDPNALAAELKVIAEQDEDFRTKILPSLQGAR